MKYDRTLGSVEYSTLGSVEYSSAADQVIDLEAEFWRAIRFTKATKMEFPFSRRVQWGVATVAFYGADRRLYEPMTAGAIAFVAPVVEGGDLVDLCAVDHNNHWATRRGLGHGLGLDVIEKARCKCADLRLMATAIDWLRRPVDSVYLFNLATLPIALDGVDTITCNSIELGERVSALLPPSQQGRVVLDG